MFQDQDGNNSGSSETKGAAPELNQQRKVRLRRISSYYNKDSLVHTVTVISDYNGMEIEVRVPVRHENVDLDTLWEQAEEYFRVTADEISRYRAANHERVKRNS